MNKIIIAIIAFTFLSGAGKYGLSDSKFETETRYIEPKNTQEKKYEIKNAKIERLEQKKEKESKIREIKGKK